MPTLPDEIRKELPDEVRSYLSNLEKRVKETNNESKARKEELRALKEAQEAEQKEADEQRRAEQEAAQRVLKEQGKYKPLYEQAQKQMADLEAELELKKQRSESYEQVLVKAVEAQRQKLPEEIRDIVPDLSPDQQLDWIAEWVDKLVRPAPPNVDADPKLGDTPKKLQLTETQKEVAKAAGMTEDAYMERLAAIS